MSGSFSEKKLRVTFTLNNSNAVFESAEGAALGNQLQISGLRMSASIQSPGFPSFPSCILKVWGMGQADMNALAVQAMTNGRTGYQPNTMLIEADSGDGRGWSAVYAGNIYEAAPDYSALPDVPLVVVSQSKLYDLVSPATPTSFPGSTSIFDAVSVIVAKMQNVSAINNGVTAVSSGPLYYSGAPADQLRTICQAFSLDPHFSPDGQLVTVSPVGAADFSSTVVLSPDSGLVGYPTPRANGAVSARCLFDPNLHLKAPVTIAGSDVVIDPGVPSTLNSIANGDWIVCSMTNSLDALVPGGAWFTDLLLYPATFAATAL